MTTSAYTSELQRSSLARRFYQHAVLAWNKDIYRKGAPVRWGEKLANVLLFPTEELPKRVIESFKNPRVVTIALTIAALAITSFVFYPAYSLLALKAALTFIAIPLPSLRFGAFITVVSYILGHSIRALSRFGNDDLMNKFYQNGLSRAADETETAGSQG